MAIIQELTAKLSFLVDKKGAKSAQESLNNLARGAKATVAALASIRGIKFAKDIIQDTVEIADTFEKMGKRLGVSSSELQKLDLVANLAGTTSKELEVAMRRLQLSVDRAASGSPEFIKQFRRLGLTMGDLVGPDGQVAGVEELLPKVANAFKNLESSTTRTALAQLLMGRGGTSLIPVLIQGSKEIERQKKEVEDLGAVIGPKFEKDSTEYIDNQARMLRVTRGFRFSVAKGLIPEILKIQKATIKWAKSNEAAILRKELTKAAKSFGEELLIISKGLKDLVSAGVAGANNLSILQKTVLAATAAFIGLGAVMAVPLGPVLALLAVLTLLVSEFGALEDEKTLGLLEGFIEQIDFLIGKTGSIKEAFKQATGDAVQFWGEFFGMLIGMTEKQGREFGKAVREAFLNPLQLLNPTELLKLTPIGQLIGGASRLIDASSELGKQISNLLSAEDMMPQGGIPREQLERLTANVPVRPPNSSQMPILSSGPITVNQSFDNTGELDSEALRNASREGLEEALINASRDMGVSRAR